MDSSLGEKALVSRIFTGLYYTFFATEISELFAHVLYDGGVSFPLVYRARHKNDRLMENFRA